MEGVLPGPTIAYSEMNDGAVVRYGGIRWHELEDCTVCELGVGEFLYISNWRFCIIMT